MLRVLFSPEKVETITLACCVLHNLLHTRVTAQQVYMLAGSVDTEDPNTHTISQGEWQSAPQPTGLLSLMQQGSNWHSSSAKQL